MLDSRKIRSQQARYAARTIRENARQSSIRGRVQISARAAANAAKDEVLEAILKDAGITKSKDTPTMSDPNLDIVSKQDHTISVSASQIIGLLQISGYSVPDDANVFFHESDGMTYSFAGTEKLTVQWQTTHTSRKD